MLENFTGMIIFEIGKKEYCADISDVLAILNPVEYSVNSYEQVKETREINLNSYPVPILKLYEKFGSDLKGNFKDTRIVTLEQGEFICGFFVERVKEILTLTNDLKTKMTFTESSDEPFVKGFFDIEGRKLLLPDYNNLLNDKSSGIN